MSSGIRKGAIPVGIILAVLVISLLLSLFYVMVSIRIDLSSKMALDFFTIVSVKNTINLTEKAYEGGMHAIGSEAVFHPLDTGIPDINDSSGNEMPASESSYLKYPLPWVNETLIEVDSSYRGQPSWEAGIIKYPEYDRDSFIDYINRSIIKFLVDNFATSFSQPYMISINYEFFEPSFENSNTSFGSRAKMSFFSSGAYIEEYNTSDFNVSYPIVPSKEFEFYEMMKKVVAGPDYDELKATKYYRVNFTEFMLNTAGTIPAPRNRSVYNDSEQNLRDRYVFELWNYSNTLSSLGLDFDFSVNKSIYRGKMETFVDGEYHKKYDAYLVNYTILANITDPAGEEFCCNWNPIGNYSSIEKPGLRVLFNDTFIGMDCLNDNFWTGSRYLGAIWMEHKNNSDNLLCEAGPSGQWYNITNYPDYGNRNLLLSLNGETYDSFWDAAEKKWYRCGYSLGDTTRIDILDNLKDYQNGSADFEEDIIEYQQLPKSGTMNFIEELSSSGSDKFFNIGRQSLAMNQSTFTYDKGQIICNLPGKTINQEGGDVIWGRICPEEPGGGIHNDGFKGYSPSFMSKNGFLRCTDTAADFHLLSVIDYENLKCEPDKCTTGSASIDIPSLVVKYCCAKYVNPGSSDYICEKGDVRFSPDCCNCFGYKWVQDGGSGYCVGDEYCDYGNGERAENTTANPDGSKDCCEKGRWIQDPENESIKIWLATNTQGFPYNDNTCHFVCNTGCEKCESGEYCTNCADVDLEYPGEAPACGIPCIPCEPVAEIMDNQTPSCNSGLFYGCRNAEENNRDIQDSCVDLCTLQTVTYDCRKSTLIYQGMPANGNELYYVINPPQRCPAGRPCKVEITYDPNGVITGQVQKCMTNECMRACGAACGQDEDCTDVCTSADRGVLTINKICQPSDCTCSAGEDVECNEFNRGANVECGGTGYYCTTNGDGIYVWLAE